MDQALRQQKALGFAPRGSRRLKWPKIAAKRAPDPKPTKETVDPKTANSGAIALPERQAGASIPAHIFW